MRAPRKFPFVFSTLCLQRSNQINAITLLLAQTMRRSYCPQTFSYPNIWGLCSEECPVCFNYHAQLNETLCCQQVLCSGCYFAVRPQKIPTDCIFCNVPKFSAKARAANPPPPGWGGTGGGSGGGVATSASRLGGKSSGWERSSPKPIGDSRSIGQAPHSPTGASKSLDVLSPASSSAAAASASTHTPPLSSSHERRQLEESMQRQRINSFDFGVNGASSSSGGGSGRYSSDGSRRRHTSHDEFMSVGGSSRSGGSSRRGRSSWTRNRSATGGDRRLEG